MRKLFGILIVLGLAVTPVLAQKVFIDYSSEFDFDNVETFQYNKTEGSNSKNPLMDERIEAAIIEALEDGGLKRVDSEPDIFVTYHITTAEDKVYQTTNFGYGGAWGGWAGWGGGMATTTETTYTEGTLIVDAYDSKEKKMVWRGTGTVTIKAKPEKQTKQIDKIISKMADRWHKIHASDAN